MSIRNDDAYYQAVGRALIIMSRADCLERFQKYKGPWFYAIREAEADGLWIAGNRHLASNLLDRIQWSHTSEGYGYWKGKQLKVLSYENEH